MENEPYKEYRVSLRSSFGLTLPEDCINLFDPNQVKYYNDNKKVQ